MRAPAVHPCWLIPAGSSMRGIAMIKSEIAEYMEKTFLFEFDADITESTDLFKAGVIDSYGYIRLMQFIQNAYQIRFSRDELLSSLITSLSGIVSVVQAKLADKVAQSSSAA
jgi:acyl carrier protein